MSVIVVDPGLRYRSVLGGAAGAHGYDPARLVGRTVEEVVPAPARARIEGLFRRALRGETVVDVSPTTDGVAVLQTTYGPVVESDVITGAAAVIRDVTVEQRGRGERAATSGSGCCWKRSPTS